MLRRWMWFLAAVGLLAGAVLAAASWVRYTKAVSQLQAEARARQVYDASYDRLRRSEDYQRLLDKTKTEMTNEVTKSTVCTALKQMTITPGSYEARLKELCDKYAVGRPPADREVEARVEPILEGMARSAAGLDYIPMAQYEIVHQLESAKQSRNAVLWRSAAAIVGWLLLLVLLQTLVSWFPRERKSGWRRLRGWTGGFGLAVIGGGIINYVVVWFMNARAVERYRLIMAGRIPASGPLDGLLDAKIASDLSLKVAVLAGVVGGGLIFLARHWPVPPRASSDQGGKRSEELDT